MRICVLIKPVIDPTSLQWNYKSQAFAYVTHSFHHTDLCALEWACTYKRECSGHVTVLIAMDADQEMKEHLLRKYEVDECIVIRVKDITHYRNEVAYMLAKESEGRAFDLVLSGSQSQDTHLGVTPIVYAELLNLPYLSQIHQIEPDEGKVWNVHRKEGRGVIETFQVELPAVIGVVSSISRRRYVARLADTTRVRKFSIVQVDGKIERIPNVKVIRVTEPKPRIRYLDVPSPALSAEKRLLEIMGFAEGLRIEHKEKSIQTMSGQTIHYLKEKLQKWLGEG
ncbi:hypothetical protein EDM56_26065 [Brevibacillus fluminis]|uniref:Electron transfer flavoprotein small subunit n=1 Tax=Brevibacillus fluminis TaxID=511487 RepID=A0A3M8D0V3_9BACL|nr:hypothetical protein [Brevibacillus fluminis]RNB81191.1 hypothetical protein EDM56_26065 [Brevibacillus fluminis]